MHIFAFHLHKKVSHAVCNNHFNQVPLTANILNKHVKIHVYTKPVLDSVVSLTFETYLCVTHFFQWNLPVKQANKDIGTQESEAIDSDWKRMTQVIFSDGVCNFNNNINQW